MSLLDHGPHQVTVFPEVQTNDFRGNIVRRPSAVGVLVTGCTMQPITSNARDQGADVAQGQRVSVRYRLITRAAPLGPWSRVEWQGRKYAVDGQPAPRTMSAATTHVSAILREER